MYTVDLDIWKNKVKPAPNATQRDPNKEVLTLFFRNRRDPAGSPVTHQDQDTATAAGETSTAQGSGSVAFGPRSRAGKDQTVAIGSDSVANARNSTVVGQNSSALAYGSTVIGRKSKASAANAVVLGRDNAAAHSSSIVIGNGLVTAAAGQVLVGDVVGNDTNAVVFGKTGAPTQIKTNLATPSTLVNGSWWVECTGVSPARVCAIKVRDGGVTRTVGSITF